MASEVIRELRKTLDNKQDGSHPEAHLQSASTPKGITLSLWDNIARALEELQLRRKGQCGNGPGVTTQWRIADYVQTQQSHS